MKIGDRIFVRGYIDEIRKDTVIVRNDGGYFGTILSEVTGELPPAQPEKRMEKRMEKRTETHACDLIDRQAAIDAVNAHYDDEYFNFYTVMDILKQLPSAQEKPFNLPEIYIAEGYDTIEDEDENVGFGVYVPDETKIYVAGDVEGEIRARALFHEVCHWVQAMCGRPFDEDEANKFSDIVYDALPSSETEIVRCKECEYGEQDEVGRWFCRSLGCQIGNEDGSGYCADAKRRTDD